MRRWSTPSRRAARKSRVARATSTIFSHIHCCRKSRCEFSSSWRAAARSAPSMSASPTTVRSPIASTIDRRRRQQAFRHRRTPCQRPQSQRCTRDLRTLESVNMATQTEVTPTLTYAQKGRAISVDTVLGPDALLLESFEGEDGIADGFCYTPGMLGKDPSIGAAKVIRHAATVKVKPNGGRRATHRR